MKVSVGVIAAALLLAPDFSPVAAACVVCDCVSPGLPREALERADAVLHGRVERVEDHLLAPSDTLPKPPREPEASAWLGRYGEQRYVQMQVLRVWKGVVSERVELFTSLGGGDCGYPFKRGVEYVVYAKRAPSGRLVTSICSRTRPVSQAAEDLAALGPGIAPTAPEFESHERPHN